MFQEIWKLIEYGQLEAASQNLLNLSIEDDYLKNVSKLLQAEVAFRKGDSVQSITIANEIFSCFPKLTPTLLELNQDIAGIGLNFLEVCILYWIYARALVAQQRWPEAWTYANLTFDRWDFYCLTRQPFLNFPSAISNELSYQKINSLLHIIRQNLGKKPSRKEILDLLVPSGFEPKPFQIKLNRLPLEPRVSVCIPSYCDGPWLQMTVDSILKHNDYSNFEIVIVLQKGGPKDSTGNFLENHPYLENPRLKVLVFDQSIGAENSKQVCYENATGEIFISLDAHVISCHNIISKTVKILLENPEVSILNYGLVATFDNQSLGNYYFNEVPYHLNALIGHVPVSHPQKMPFYKPGLYRRTCLIGAAFCLTRELFKDVGGYLLKNHSWGDKCLGMSAYLCGYDIFASPDLVCIHKWHTEEPHPWQRTHRRTAQFEYPNEIPSSAFIVGYFYFSSEYFHRYFIPWVKPFCGNTFDFHWQRFQEQLPLVEQKKAIFWQSNAVRSVREYWLDFWDYIWPKLNEAERTTLCQDFDLNSF